MSHDDAVVSIDTSLSQMAESMSVNHLKSHISKIVEPRFEPGQTNSKSWLIPRLWTGPLFHFLNWLLSSPRKPRRMSKALPNTRRWGLICGSRAG